MDNQDQITKITHQYLDGMMPGSKVNYLDLLFYVKKESGYTGTHQTIDAMIHGVVQSRNDFMVMRGRGICKR